MQLLNYLKTRMKGQVKVNEKELKKGKKSGASEETLFTYTLQPEDTTIRKQKRRTKDREK